MATKYDNDLDIIGNSSSSYKEVEKALLNIGKDFGLTKEELVKGEITRENLFKNTDEVIVIE